MFLLRVRALARTVLATLRIFALLLLSDVAEHVGTLVGAVRRLVAWHAPVHLQTHTERRRVKSGDCEQPQCKYARNYVAQPTEYPFVTLNESTKFSKDATALTD